MLAPVDCHGTVWAYNVLKEIKSCHKNITKRKSFQIMLLNWLKERETVYSFCFRTSLLTPDSTVAGFNDDWFQRTAYVRSDEGSEL